MKFFIAVLVTIAIVLTLVIQLADRHASRVAPVLPNDCMSYVKDVTLNDTELLPVLKQGTEHIKTWKVGNCGTSTWKGYELRRIFYSGPQVGVGKNMSPLSVVIPEIGPGQEGDISITITVPAAAGDYKALFELAIPEGNLHYQAHRFGDPLWTSFTAR